MHQSLGGYYKKIQKVEKDNLKYRRSIFAIKNIKKGEKLTEKNIASFRPKIGINSNRFFRIIGRKVKSNIKKFSPIFEKEIKR